MRDLPCIARELLEQRGVQAKASSQTIDIGGIGGAVLTCQNLRDIAGSQMQQQEVEHQHACENERGMQKAAAKQRQQAVHAGAIQVLAMLVRIPPAPVV